MRNARIDTNSDHRCWHCGGKSLVAKHTTRSKMLIGIGPLLTKKKLKCTTCGKYNDTGNPEPYTGPASKHLGKKYGTFTAMYGAEAAPTQPIVVRVDTVEHVDNQTQ